MKHSEESKLKQSIARKKWLFENPDKHVWKRNSKFKSVPCEKLKEYLKQENIAFVEEYTPLIERAFSIDIAFPDKLIALEVNGNQHYERDGSLKSYYQKRTKLLEDNGWVVYDIHYSSCFKQHLITPIVQEILQSSVKLQFDYLTYVKREKPKFYCPSCNKETTGKGRSTLCRLCIAKSTRKATWPTAEKLEELIWNLPILTIAKQYKVSDNAVINWCRKYEISRPGRGYWRKIECRK